MDLVDRGYLLHNRRSNFEIVKLEDIGKRVIFENTSSLLFGYVIYSFNTIYSNKENA